MVSLALLSVTVFVLIHDRIIVGVKYCFRYNQRNRQLRAMGENGEPIDLANLHGPRRRRREKKLMTMEEVNERFPLIKYKIWRSKREEEGLPAEGGVTAPPSRAASVRSKRTAASVAERASHESVRDTAAGASHGADASTGIEYYSADATQHEEEKTQAVVSEKAPQLELRRASGAEADEDEEDPISTAVAPEMLSAPGDSCAICLDTLEDDDDVRGLTCGHAFHAGCVDPWLTSRRACCPLCKADYYVPKPRPEGAEDPAPATQGANIQQPPPTWMYSRTGMSLRSMNLLTRGPPMFGNSADDRSQPNSRRQASQAAANRSQSTSSSTWRDRLSTMPSLRMPRFGRTPPQPTTTAGEHGVPEEIATPGELEAGRANPLR